MRGRFFRDEETPDAAIRRRNKTHIPFKAQRQKQQINTFYTRQYIDMI